jgi:hypothetical protein
MMANNEARVRAEPLDPAANLERKASRIERLSAEDPQFRETHALHPLLQQGAQNREMEIRRSFTAHRYTISWYRPLGLYYACPV